MSKSSKYCLYCQDCKKRYKCKEEMKKTGVVYCRSYTPEASKYYNAKEKELYDEKVLSVLKKLPEMYENGEIAEVADYCYDIYNAVLEFAENFEI